MSIIPEKRTEFSIPAFEDLTMMIFGIPGSGKTRFMAGCPGTLFLATEPGQQFTKATVVDITSWEKFATAVKELAEQRKAGKLIYQSVVIDIVDNLNIMCRDWVCAQKGMAYPSDKDFGKTWSECNKTWTEWIRSLMRITNVKFITHSSTETVEVQNEMGIREELQRYIPTFSGNRAAQYLDGVVNAVGFITQAKSGKRVITFAQDPRIAAKDRTDVLSKLGVIVLPENPDAGFGVVADAYAAKAKELGMKIIERNV